MKYFHTLLSVLLLSLSAVAQQLPDSWELSANNHLMASGEENQAGFFDASDGQFAGSIPALENATYGRFYIEAVADDAAGSVTYEPKGAEHDVFFYQVNNTSALSGDIVINEFMASNGATQADQDGEFDDWIELYNNTNAAVDIGGFSLSDDASELDKFTFPEGTTIAADGYLIVWADGDTEQEGLHAAFGLSAGGETLLFSDASFAIIDSVTYQEQQIDISHGRFPNGTGDFADMNPSFNAENNEGLNGDDGELDDSPLSGDLVVNEFMASNVSTQADQDGEFDDWIELYNNSRVAISLDGFHLSDEVENPTKWAFPSGTTIGAGAYLIIWADGDTEQAGLHADFGLSGGGESVLLTDADTARIDQVDYPEQNEDISYGRSPNGTGDFTTMEPTFGAENMLTTSTQSVASNRYQLRVFPNPAGEIINLYADPSTPRGLPYVVYDVTGKVMTEGVLNGSGIIESHNWVPGLYTIQCAEVRLKVIVR